MTEPEQDQPEPMVMVIETAVRNDAEFTDLLRRIGETFEAEGAPTVRIHAATREVAESILSHFYTAETPPGDA